MNIEEELSTVRRNIALDRQRIKTLEVQIENINRKLEVLEGQTDNLWGS